MKPNALIILARYPNGATVKTRLAKEIGSKKANFFYKNSAEYIFSQVQKISQSVKIFILFSDLSEKQQIKDWIPNNFSIISPQTDNIDQNINSAFEQIFNQGFKKGIVIATDTPDIKSHLISKAFLLLDETDIVIGPDNDGGIYLFGQKQPHPQLFNQHFSKHQMFDQTILKINQIGLSYKIINQLIDIDTLADLKNWLKANPSHKLTSAITRLSGPS